MATSAERRLAAREEEERRNRSGMRAAWAFLWTLFAFKIVTVGVIWWAATSTHSDETSFIIATTWYWFLIPIAAISGPLLFRWRLIQMRRRRHALRGSEWMGERREESHSPTTLTVEDILYERDRNSA
jgi:hypothetical protein